MKPIQTRTLRAAAAVLLVSICAFALPAHAREFKKPEFTVTVPNDWMEVPQKVIARYNHNLAKASPTGHVPTFSYGFQSKAAKGWLEYPYILVRVTTHGRIPEAEFKKLRTMDLNKEVAKRKKDLPTFMSKTFIGAPVYDPSSNTVWISAKLTVDGIGEVQGLSVMVPTHDGYVQLSAYTTKAKFAQYFPMFRRILTSVVIPEGNRY